MIFTYLFKSILLKKILKNLKRIFLCLDIKCHCEQRVCRLLYTDGIHNCFNFFQYAKLRVDYIVIHKYAFSAFRVKYYSLKQEPFKTDWR